MGLTELLQENYPTGLLAGGAFAPYERFAAGKTSAQAEFISAEHFKPRGGGRLRRPKPKKKDICLRQMSFFLEGTVKIDIS